MRFAIAIFLAASASAQLLSVGLKGGVPLTQALAARTDPALAGFFSSWRLSFICDSATQRTVPYVVGPALEIHLIGPFRLTAEGLYSRVDYDYTSKEFTPSSGIHFYQAKHAVSQWEFPLLVKYRMRAHRLYPFVAGGASVRYSRDYTVAGFLGGEFDPFFPVINAFSGGPSARYTVAGPTFAAGASFGASRVRPSLEVRFTHWIQQPIREGGFTSLSFTAFGPNQSLHSTQNQAQLLVGLMF